MSRQQSIALTAAVLAGLLQAGCVGSAPKTGDDAPSYAGGNAGTACEATDPVKACAPDGTGVVRCEAGAWKAAGSCGKGMTCVEKKENDKVTDATCEAGKPVNPSLMVACSLARACGVGPKVSKCVDRTTAEAWASAMKSFGVLLDFPEADIVYRHRDCITGAKSCSAVQDCVAGPAKAICAKQTKKRLCDGGEMVLCGSTPVIIECSRYGLSCVETGGDVQCIKTVPCSGPEGSSCAGDSAQLCMATKDGYVGFQADCGALGRTCGAPKSGGAIKCLAPEAPCDPKTYPGHCDGNTAVRCSSGNIHKQPCALFGQVCVMESNEDWRNPGGPKINVPDCERPGTEIKNACTGGGSCKDGVMTACEGGRMVELSCADYGLVCAGSACGFKP